MLAKYVEKLPPSQALNNKANMLFDAHTVDIEISAGQDKLLRCMMGRRRMKIVVRNSGKLFETLAMG